MKTDVLIIGAGPAGIFTALEMVRRGSSKKILIVEKGQPVEKRRCPKAVAGIASTASPTVILPLVFPVRVPFRMENSPCPMRLGEICRS